MDGIRDLEQKLSEWSRAGLLTPDQSGRILEHERAATEDRPRSSAMAEILGYLGGALALIAAIVLAAEFWSGLGVGARLGIVGSTAVLVGLAAWMLGQNPSSVILRLSDFLFAVATVALGFFVGLIASELGGTSGGAGFSLGAGSAAIVSVALWRLRSSPVRHLAMFASLAVTAIALMSNLEHLDSVYFGLGIWALGLAWAAVAWSGAVAPVDLGLALGSSALLIGSIVASFGDLTVGNTALGLGTAAALITAGVVLSSVFVLVAGTVAVFILVPRIAFDSFGDAGGGAVALLVSGLVLVAAAVGVSRLGRRVVAESRRSTRRRASGREFGITHRRAVVVAAIALVVLVAGFILLVGYVPPPSFPDVSEAAPAPPGTVVFQRWEDQQTCIYTIPAAGGRQDRVACDPEFGQPLGWTADGHIAVLTYGPEAARVKVLHPTTGEVVATGAAVGAEQAMYEAHEARGRFGGKQLEATAYRGSAGIATRSEGDAVGDSLEEILRVEAPRTYGMWDLQWSPDGRWILVVDSENRIIVAAADGSRGPFLVVKEANSPAWFIPGNDTYTVTIEG